MCVWQCVCVCNNTASQPVLLAMAACVWRRRNGFVASQPALCAVAWLANADILIEPQIDMPGGL
jgi:hypothetical protein